MIIGFLERSYLKNQGLDDDDVDWLIELFDGDGPHIVATLQAVWPRLSRDGPRLLQIIMKILQRKQ